MSVVARLLVVVCLFFVGVVAPEAADAANGLPCFLECETLDRAHPDSPKPRVHEVHSCGVDLYWTPKPDSGVMIRYEAPPLVTDKDGQVIEHGTRRPYRFVPGKTYFLSLHGRIGGHGGVERMGGVDLAKSRLVHLVAQPGNYGTATPCRTRVRRESPSKPPGPHFVALITSSLPWWLAVLERVEQTPEPPSMERLLLALRHQHVRSCPWDPLVAGASRPQGIWSGALIREPSPGGPLDAWAGVPLPAAEILGDVYEREAGRFRGTQAWKRGADGAKIHHWSHDLVRAPHGGLISLGHVISGICSHFYPTLEEDPLWPRSHSTWAGALSGAIADRLAGRASDWRTARALSARGPDLASSVLGHAIGAEMTNEMRLCRRTKGGDNTAPRDWRFDNVAIRGTPFAGTLSSLLASWLYDPNWRRQAARKFGEANHFEGLVATAGTRVWPRGTSLAELDVASAAGQLHEAAWLGATPTRRLELSRAAARSFLEVLAHMLRSPQTPLPPADDPSPNLELANAAARPAPWRALASFRPPKSVQGAIYKRGDAWEIQRIEVAAASLVSLDFYRVRVTKLPSLNGAQVTAAELLEWLRRDINRAVPAANTTFPPMTPADVTSWKGRSTALETVLLLRLDPPLPLLPVENAPLTCSSMSHTPDGEPYKSALLGHWRFSTIRAGEPTPLHGLDSKERPGEHPVSGNREFGFYAESDAGPWVFYTQGADRGSVSRYTLFGGYPTLPYRLADALWREFTCLLSARINKLGGEARPLVPLRRTPHWKHVKDVVHRPGAADKWYDRSDFP